MPRSPHAPKKTIPADPTRPRVDTDATPSRNAVGSPGDSTILLVDDDPAVRESLGRVLATEGWRVITAASGAEALERLAEKEPDLMITDLRMTDINGWDLLFHEQMQRPKMPIFVITALPPTSTGGANAAAAEFFQKPLELDLLVAAIRRRLRRPPSA